MSRIIEINEEFVEMENNGEDITPRNRFVDFPLEKASSTALLALGALNLDCVKVQVETNYKAPVSRFVVKKSFDGDEILAAGPWWPDSENSSATGTEWDLVLAK